MKKLGLFALLFAIILILSGPGLELAQASADVSQEMAPIVSGVAKAPWFIDTIDADGSVGTHVSIAFAPVSGQPFVSYYDEANQDLRLARRVTANGNCGPNNTWLCEVIDSGGDVGMYSSIAFHQTENGWKAGIAYYDATNQALKYASYSCSPLCPQNWSRVTVHQASGFDHGRHTSLVFDDTGAPHISYQVIYNSPDPSIDPVTYSLYYAHYVETAGNCGDSQWSCDSVDISVDGTQGIGMYTSLAVSDAGVPFIAYYDGKNGSLKTAMPAEINGNCGATDWNCATIDGGSGADVGLHASMSIHQDPDAIAIAYYDATNDKLKYAYIPDDLNDANCGDGVGPGGSQIWRCYEIDDMGGAATTVDLAMAHDADGHPMIAYTDEASTIFVPTNLNLARPTAALGIMPGNCGPSIPLTLQFWQCNQLDDGGSENLFEGGFVSVAVSPSGLAAIAYTERDQSNGDFSLKIAYQQMVIHLPLTIR
jgi:hypothetical protein